MTQNVVLWTIMQDQSYFFKNMTIQINYIFACQAANSAKKNPIARYQTVLEQDMLWVSFDEAI